MLRLAEREDAEREGEQCPDRAQDDGLHRGILGPQEDIAHEGDEAVHRIELHDREDDGGRPGVDELVGNPENGSEVRPGGEHDAPQVDDIAEEYGEGADGEADPNAEDDEQQQTDGEPDDVPRGDDAEPKHDDGHRDKREREVHQCEKHLLDGEDEAGDLHLLEQRGGVEEGRQGSACGFGHEGEGDVSQNKVQRIVLDVRPEDEGEDDAHDGHHEQGVEHRPDNAQHASAIFELEILGDELL